jgi:phosphoglycerate kinase
MAGIDTYDFSGKRALIRVDFNVPLCKETLKVTDDTRIQAALKTINKVLDGGGSVVLMSHLGRPKRGPEEKFSMSNIVYKIEELLGKEITFVGDCIGETAFETTANLKPGQVVLLGNLRFYPHETQGNEEFAKSLAKHGDVYINDAFGTAHRAHASTAIIAKFFPNDKMFGYLIEREIESVNKVLNSIEKPLTAIVGGAKVSSKITIIEQLLEKVDNIIIGGGMAFTFVKAQGGKVGSSLVEDDFLDTANSILAKAKEKGVEIFIPTDTATADKFENDAQKEITDINTIKDGWMGLDIGPESIKKFENVILDSKLILFNGPMGVFEMDNFQAGTQAISNAIAEATSKGAFTVVGGGDSVAAINKYHLKDKVSFVSTGGGAMLEYLEGKELPGIAAINN